MTFEDLSRQNARGPITGPTMAADLVDLFLSIRDRLGGALLFALCDRSGAVQTPVVISGAGQALERDPAREMAAIARALPDMPGLLFGLGRPGPDRLTDADRRWHEAVVALARDRGLRLHGAFLATPDAVTAFPDPLDAAEVEGFVS